MTDTSLRLQPRWILAWILVCALNPIFQVLGWTAAGKTVLPADPHAALLWPALIALAVLAPLAQLALSTWVMTRIAPRLRWWAMAPALVLAVVAGMAIELTGVGLRSVQLEFLTGLQHLRTDFEWGVLAALPWPRLLAQSGAIAAATFCVPALLFARAAGVRWFVPLAAVMAAGMAAAVAEQGWQLAADWWRHFNESALNGWSWAGRLEALCLLAGKGALWGTAGAAVFLGLAARPPQVTPRPRLVPAVLALFGALLVLPPLAAYLAIPYRAERAWDSLLSALSRAPAGDVSEGEPRVRLAAASAAKLPEVPSLARFSPDGATVLTINGQRQLTRIDTATGAALGTLGERLALYEVPSWAWSADGRWLALRSRARERKVGNYVEHQVRVRLYAVPGYRLVADYSHEGLPCYEQALETTPLFESGDRAVWIGCGTATQPKPDSLLALRLSIPELRPVGERRYGDLAPLALRRLAVVRGAVWSWHHGYGRNAQARLRDLSADREAVWLGLNPATGHGDTMTLQGATFGDDTVALRYSVGLERGMQTFVHDSRTGAFLRTDEEAAPFLGSDHVRALAAPQGWRIESRWQPRSKAGELLVFDAEGKRRQQVHSVAQSLLSVSPDGRWFATRAAGDGRLRIYRIEP